MENEIKVGEYCRTSAGKIFKCSEIVLGYIPKDENKTMIVNYIVKHSSNLIDIIEERRLCKWNISNRKRRYIIMDRNKRNRQKWISYTN